MKPGNIDDDFKPISAESTGFGWLPPVPVKARLVLQDPQRSVGPWSKFDGHDIVIRARATNGALPGTIELEIAEVAVAEPGGGEDARKGRAKARRIARAMIDDIDVEMLDKVTGWQD